MGDPKKARLLSDVIILPFFCLMFVFAVLLKESFPTVWHMKNMLESFKKDHQVRGCKVINNKELPGNRISSVVVT